MLDQGAAPAIIALAASSNNRHLRSECVEALCKLAVQPGSEAHIIAEVSIENVRERGQRKIATEVRKIQAIVSSNTRRHGQG